MASTKRLIDSFEWVRAAEKKFAEPIVVVPFFGGKKPALRRHAHFFSSLGYDTLLFELTYSSKTLIKGLPLTKYFKFGLKHQWTDEISTVLDSISGNKLVYAFSNPSSCAIAAVSSRRAKDISGLVCDSGPFLDVWRGNWNYLTFEKPIKNPLLKMAIETYVTVVWGLDHNKSLLRDIENLPKNFSLLSVRGWKDPLVSVKMINAAFENVDHLNFETLALPEGAHLNGLKDFADIYKPRVGEFLKKNSLVL